MGSEEIVTSTFPTSTNQNLDNGNVGEVLGIECFEPLSTYSNPGDKDSEEDSEEDSEKDSEEEDEDSEEDSTGLSV